MAISRAVTAYRLSRRAWGYMPSGAVVHAYELTNARGTSVTVLTLGAIIASIRVAGRDGTRDDVVLGMTDVDGYLTRSPYFGAVTGRFGNRIARGRFTLDGVTYQLATNNAPNHLHGGVVGFEPSRFGVGTKANWSGGHRASASELVLDHAAFLTYLTHAMSLETNIRALAPSRAQHPGESQQTSDDTPGQGARHDSTTLGRLQADLERLKQQLAEKDQEIDRLTARGIVACAGEAEDGA